MATIIFNAFTAIITVVFLLIMMMRNVVPITNNILISSGISVTFFVMSLVTLIFHFICHEAASYMVLKHHWWIMILYGAAILALGISCLVVGNKDSGDQSTQIWNNVLSENQKEFFNNLSETDPPSG